MHHDRRAETRFVGKRPPRLNPPRHGAGYAAAQHSAARRGQPEGPRKMAAKAAGTAEAWTSTTTSAPPR